LIANRFAVKTISVALTYFLEKLKKESTVHLVEIAVVCFCVALLEISVANHSLSQILVELLMTSSNVLFEIGLCLV